MSVPAIAERVVDETLYSPNIPLMVLSWCAFLLGGVAGALELAAAMHPAAGGVWLLVHLALVAWVIARGDAK